VSLEIRRRCRLICYSQTELALANGETQALAPEQPHAPATQTLRAAVVQSPFPLHSQRCVVALHTETPAPVHSVLEVHSHRPVTVLQVGPSPSVPAQPVAVQPVKQRPWTSQRPAVLPHTTTVSAPPPSIDASSAASLVASDPASAVAPPSDGGTNLFRAIGTWGDSQPASLGSGAHRP